MWDDDDLADKSDEAIRLEWVDGELGQWTDSDTKDALSKARRSEYGRALDAISRAGLEHTRNTATSGGFREAFEAELERGMGLVRDLWWATQPYDTPEDERRKLRLWSHRLQPLYDVRAKKMPHFDRTEIEQLVGVYLKLPYRSEDIDRVFVDLLIAMELYGFADEMLNEVVIPEIGPPRSPLRQPHPFPSYFKGLFQNAAFFALIALGIYALYKLRLISVGWMAGLIAVDGGLFLLCVGLATVALPLVWIDHAKRVRRVHSLIDTMTSAYHELRSDGPVSVRHLQECLKAAHDQGARWPAPLYALLDDAVARTGRV